MFGCRVRKIRFIIKHFKRKHFPKDIYLLTNHHEICWGILPKKTHTKNTSNVSLAFPLGLGGRKKIPTYLFQGQVNQVKTHQVEKNLSKPLGSTLRGEAGCSVIWPNYYTPWKIFTAGTYSHHPWKERNMIWTKPPGNYVNKPFIFRGVCHQLRFSWNKIALGGGVKNATYHLLWEPENNHWYNIVTNRSEEKQMREEMIFLAFRAKRHCPLSRKVRKRRGSQCQNSTLRDP